MAQDLRELALFGILLSVARVRSKFRSCVREFLDVVNFGLGPKELVRGFQVVCLERSACMLGCALAISAVTSGPAMG